MGVIGEIYAERVTKSRERLLRDGGRRKGGRREEEGWPRERDESWPGWGGVGGHCL